MNRHGIVIPREDGVSARCMGPGYCSDCNKDMADATLDQRIDYITKEFGRRWSQPNSDLRSLVAWTLACSRDYIDAYKDGGDDKKPMTIGIPLPDAIKEMQFLYCLAYVTHHFAMELQADEITNGVAWLALKHGAMR